MILLKILIINLLSITSNCGNPDSPNTSVIWTLDQMDKIGEYHPEILGNPEIVNDKSGLSIYFNGKSDGLIVPVNPVEGWEQFTVEIFFKPDSDGLPEQRFVHFQDEDNHRGLIETRVTPEGEWTLDSFLYNNETKIGLTLIDRGILHPCDNWYWAALVYDGKTMSHYINGKKELEGDIDFGPMKAGRISLGVRLNQVHWFKGMIREIRFHPAALESDALQLP